MIPFDGAYMGESPPANRWGLVVLLGADGLADGGLTGGRCAVASVGGRVGNGLERVGRRGARSGDGSGLVLIRLVNGLEADPHVRAGEGREFTQRDDVLAGGLVGVDLEDLNGHLPLMRGTRTPDRPFDSVRLVGGDFHRERLGAVVRLDDVRLHDVLTGLTATAGRLERRLYGRDVLEEIEI